MLLKLSKTVSITPGPLLYEMELAEQTASLELNATNSKDEQ